MNRQLNELEANGIIEPSTSEWKGKRNQFNIRTSIYPPPRFVASSTMIGAAMPSVQPAECTEITILRGRIPDIVLERLLRMKCAFERNYLSSLQYFRKCIQNNDNYNDLGNCSSTNNAMEGFNSFLKRCQTHRTLLPFGSFNEMMFRHFAKKIKQIQT